MKRLMSIAAIALFMAGSTALACDSCGCKAKQAEKKAECTACTAEKKCEACAKKCADKCAAAKKECSAKKAAE